MEGIASDPKSVRVFKRPSLLMKEAVASIPAPPVAKKEGAEMLTMLVGQRCTTTDFLGESRAPASGMMEAPVFATVMATFCAV